MKPIRMLFMLVACIATFTVTATTAKPEQKQKAELVKEFAPFTNAVSVVTTFEIVSVKTDTNVFQDNETVIYVKSYEPTNHSIVLDVSWQLPKLFLTDNIYKEKLHNIDKLQFQNKRLSGFRIRNEC